MQESSSYRFGLSREKKEKRNKTKNQSFVRDDHSEENNPTIIRIFVSFRYFEASLIDWIARLLLLDCFTPATENSKHRAKQERNSTSKIRNEGQNIDEIC